MANIRGFVQRIDVGRAGLVVVTLLHEDGSSADYHLPDLDADPERFNERLSKLGVLRDAMSRAEPVEIEFVVDDDAPNGSRYIQRAVRITRDQLDLPTPLVKVTGLVIGIAVYSENRAGAAGEKSDVAVIGIISPDETTMQLQLDLQIPERGVAAAQLDIVREARRRGRSLEFTFRAKDRRITGVNSVTGAGNFPDPRLADGFVEAISHVEAVAVTHGIAIVRFTTAPPFGGTGNYVPLAAFAPEVLTLYVFKGSDDYALLEAGLRDGLRMRVALARLGAEERGDRVALFDRAPSATGETKADGGGGVLIGAELLAPLASAARPVWIKISRRTLDHGPDGPVCTEGVPSSDLSPRGLRDLRLPYPAEWIGIGCFNHGVYRFQLDLGVDFEISVDGEPLCVHDAEDSALKFAHACLGGEHEVKVQVQNWTCERQFVMDVYRIR